MLTGDICRYIIYIFGLLHTVVSFSTTPSFEFRKYDFDSTGICRSPSSFQYKEEDKEAQYFVLRNVPGDGDW